ncbi:hypothetical protein [Streptomyces lateritius]|uniref:hypothetical protein n=1 Tax=Streptomyces lateritius TaxID=67313 RepID=UPI0019BCFD1D|nr:hypothetical protein [Streptomyces lateritius]GGT69940.1 hypothetical protein GCM10010272_11310 [Streptomyces lateritius]
MSSGGTGPGGTSGLPDGERDDMGHEIVNDGPDKARAEDRPGGDGPFADEDGQGLFAGEEPALRSLLHGAVADLQPSEGALDHLRRAVPARRARKRQAIVGIAAAAVLIGTAVPAFVHVANSGGIATDQSVNAGHGQQAQGGTGTGAETGVEGGAKTAAPSAATVSPSQGEAAGAGRPTDAAPDKSGGTGADATQPVESQPDSSPVCEAGQLGVSSAQAGGPDAEGKVYGTFRIANISGEDCVVSGAGSIGFQALGAADPAKITVVEHAAGDPASGLPDPSQESPTLILKPDNAYEVRFAWVPTETCPTTGTPPDPTTSPDGDGTGGTGGTSAGGGGSSGTDSTGENTAPQLGTEDGTPADGSIAVSHTAEPGSPQAATTIPNACAGTIYRTGVLDAS